MEVSLGDVPAPQPRRALKRSASAVSLPTPPRTHRRHRRGRSRGSCDSESEDDDTGSVQGSARSSDEEGGELPNVVRNPRKKRRLSQSKDEDGDEEAFWLGALDSDARHQDEIDGGHQSSLDKEKADKDDDSSSSAPLLYRKSLRRSQSCGSTGLASPPPSLRKPQVVAPVTPPGPSTSAVLPKIQSVSPPKTPKRQPVLPKGPKTPEFPIISNSPDNPFYEVPVSSSPEEETESPLISPVPAKTTQYEKPTVTYVFRGVRREYHNPMYDPVKKRALSPPPASFLPIEHEDYSPDIGCKPRVLFPKARKGKRSAATKAGQSAGEGESGLVRRSPRRKKATVGDSGDEGSEAEGPMIQPKKLDFGLPKNAKSKAKGAPSKAKTASAASDDPF